MQPEEVATLGNHLPRKLDRRALPGPRAEENTEQLGARKRLRTLRKQPLPRPELGRELLDGVSATFHSGIVYYTADRDRASARYSLRRHAGLGTPASSYTLADELAARRRAAERGPASLDPALSGSVVGDTRPRMGSRGIRGGPT